MLTELSLFTGAGGGVYGSILIGTRIIGYVEWDEYRCKVIEQRIKDGIFDDAPIWQGDIGEFNRRVASIYTGRCDLVSAGFPCPPFSNAGLHLAEADPRNKWPETIDAIRIIRPQFALLENVSAILSKPYVQRIFGDLAESGYDAQWMPLSAGAEGAPIKRDRLFIACANKGNGEKGMGFLEDWQKALRKRSAEQCPSFWLQTPPRTSGVGNGMADYRQRVEAIGDGQVPAVVRAAWKILMPEAIKHAEQGEPPCL